jgi:hypothetical protein
MAIRSSKKTRKNCKKTHRDCNKDAKKATQLKCRMKTCRSKKYMSVFGSTCGSIRSNRQLFY